MENRTPHNACKQHLRFSPSEWVSDGNHKRLKGHNITVLQWNTGAKANFALEAHETTERVTQEVSISFGGHAPAEGARNIYRTIPGTGPYSRDDSIRQAKELAATGKYTLTAP